MPEESHAGHAPGWPIFSVLLKVGIEPGDAFAFVNELLITPADKRTSRLEVLLEDLLRRYRRCDSPDGSVRNVRIRERCPIPPMAELAPAGTAAFRSARRRGLRMLVPGTLLALGGPALMMAGQGWPGVLALDIGTALIAIWAFRDPPPG
ncbi:MAG: hypothetical protein OXH99_07770 [Bryobacterales bacterium]|nr:hypothetical protein [Bryobacterales bacterium]